MTQDVVKVLRPAAQRYEIRDTENKHLVVRVTPSGHKSFAYLRRINGRLQRRTIGTFPEYTVARARADADQFDGLVASGEPLDPKALQVLTLQGLFDRYLEEHAKPYKKSWKRDENAFALYLKDLKDRKAADLERGDIRALHDRIVRDHGKYTANRVLALVRKMFNFAMDRDLLDRNPADRIRQAPEQSRRRFMSPDELKAFFKAVEDPEIAGWRDFFLLLLYTGQRRGNVQAMRWADLDLQHAVWHIPPESTKNAEPYAVPLVPPAVEILTARRDEVEAEWVFPGPGKSGHVEEPKKAWATLCEKAGLHDLRIHDLRRTMGSYQAAGNTSLQIIGQSLGHKSMQATQVYSRLQLAPVRKAMEDAVSTMRNVDTTHRAE